MATIGTMALAKGDIFTSAHVLAINRANDGYAIISGCDVHEQSTPAMGVTIDAGYVFYNGAYVTVAGGNITVDAADATYPRMDIVYINASGSPIIAKGTAAAILPTGETAFKKMISPYPSASIPTGVIIARIYVAAAVTTILNAVIDDISLTGNQVPLNTLTTRGDIPYKGADSGWTRLAKGTSGYALVQGANDPSWVQLDHNTHLSNLTTGDVHTQYLNTTRGDARYALLATGVTNGNSHDHSGGDGAQIDHGGLAGLSDDDHTQYLNTTRGDARYALLANGVTNGNSHDHNGGDGAQINHTTLSNIGSNTHATIDSHLSSTSNPHSTTAAQVGADITTGTTHAATSKATPVDADELALIDSATSYGLKRLTWSNLKATNKTYTDTLYSLLGHTHTGVYALLANGVTNGDSHDHYGGDGAQVTHWTLAGLGNDDHTQYYNQSRGDARYSLTGHNHTGVYALLANGVTNGDSHDHNGGDGATIAYSTLSGLPTRRFTIPFTYGDGHSVILPETYVSSVEIEIPVACTIIAARMHERTGTAGSAYLTLYRRTYSGGWGILDDYTITSSTLYEETGMSISLAAGDWITVVLGSVSSLQQITFSLTCECV